MSSEEKPPKKQTGEGSHQLQRYDPVRYASDHRVIRNPNRMVTHIHFIAQTVLKSGGNHWTMYLQTGPNEAVRINMDPATCWERKFLGTATGGKCKSFIGITA